MKKQQETQNAILPDAAPYYFHQGSTVRAFDYLGAHREGEDVVFRVWAPNAEYVSVIGDFNGWDAGKAPMTRVTERGVWETRLGGVNEGQKYKYFIRNGCRELHKADPYGFRMETPPDTASVVCDIEGYAWRDAGWMKYRSRSIFMRYTRAPGVGMRTAPISATPSLPRSLLPTSSRWDTHTSS